MAREPGRSQGAGSPGYAPNLTQEQKINRGKKENKDKGSRSTWKQRSIASVTGKSKSRPQGKFIITIIIRIYNLKIETKNRVLWGCGGIRALFCIAVGMKMFQPLQKSLLRYMPKIETICGNKHITQSCTGLGVDIYMSTGRQRTRDAGHLYNRAWSSSKKEWSTDILKP